MALNNLALALKGKGDAAGAEALLREAVAAKRGAMGGGHPSTLGSVNNLAAALVDLGRRDEAEPLYREALAGLRAALGDRHPDTLSTMSNLAVQVQSHSF